MRLFSCSIIRITIACGLLAGLFLALQSVALASQHQAPVTGQAAGQVATPLKVQAGLHQGFQRLVFTAHHAIGVTMEQQGATLILAFSGHYSGDVAHVLKPRFSFVKAAQWQADGANSQLRLQLAEGVVARHFSDANTANPRYLIIDFYPGSPAASPPIPPASTPPPNQQPAPQADKQTDKAEAKTEAGLALPHFIPPPASASPAPPPSEPVLRPFTSQPTLLLGFDPGIKMQAALFRRADFVYLVFDKKLGNAWPQWVRDNAGLVLARLPEDQVKGGTVLRFYLPQDAALRVTRERSAWLLFASKKTASAALSLDLRAEPTYAVGARLFLPLNRFGEALPGAVRFTDPEIGDTLLALPLQPGQAMRHPYRYADFTFVAAEQGVVIHPYRDGVALNPLNQGIEITAPGGLHLSPDPDTGMVSVVQHGEQIYDFNAWYGDHHRNYTQMRQHWEQALAEVPEQERNRVRFGFARFLLARNHAYEARGMLVRLQSTLPEIEKNPAFISLRGAVAVLLGDAEAGLRDLTLPEFAETLESKLWQGVAQVKLGHWQEATTLFNAADALLADYPEPFFSRFSIAAIEAAIAADNRYYAATVLDRLEQRTHENHAGELFARPANSDFVPAVAYLRASLLNLAGRPERAEALWQKVAASSDRFYRVRAELALVDLAVLHGTMSPLAAAQRLEQLRYGWRGDDLELDILSRIGRFYIEAGKVETGLNNLQQVLDFQSDKTAAENLRAEMANVVRDNFTDTSHPALSPLEALSLYQHFSAFVPQGEDGDAMIKNLAQRMVGVDLLDRAALLLADQARTRLHHTLKARAGASAAGLYLLDHQPAIALQVLGETQEEGLPASLVEERQLLTAKATADLGKNDAAKAMLEPLQSAEARRLQADIAWRARDWAGAEQALKTLIKPPPDPGARLDADQAQLLVNRAMALAMASNLEGLDQLRRDYTAAMKPTPQAEIFRILTDPEPQLPADSAALKATPPEVDLFQEFLEQYRTIR